MGGYREGSGGGGRGMGWMARGLEACVVETCSSVSGDVGGAAVVGERRVEGEGGASPGCRSRNPARQICAVSIRFPQTPTWRHADTTINGEHQVNQMPPRPRSAHPPHISRNYVTPMSHHTCTSWDGSHNLNVSNIWAATLLRCILLLVLLACGIVRSVRSFIDLIPHLQEARGTCVLEEHAEAKVNCPRCARP